MQRSLEEEVLTIAALLLTISAFSTKPNLDVMSSGSMGASVAPCMTDPRISRHLARSTGTSTAAYCQKGIMRHQKDISTRWENIPQPGIAPREWHASQHGASGEYCCTSACGKGHPPWEALGLEGVASLLLCQPRPVSAVLLCGWGGYANIWSSKVFRRACQSIHHLRAQRYKQYRDSEDHFRAHLGH